MQFGAFSVLKELAIVLPDSVADHIGSLVPSIEKALCVSIASCVISPNLGLLLSYLFYFFCQDKSSTSNLKIEALIFTRLVLASHSSTVLYPYIEVNLYIGM